MTSSQHGSHGDTGSFHVVGLPTGVTVDDNEHLQQHPHDLELIRPVIAGELEAAGEEASGATDVYVYAVRDFDGLPTGQRHRMLLRRVEARR